jgi:hypothetical protein
MSLRNKRNFVTFCWGFYFQLQGVPPGEVIAMGIQWPTFANKRPNWGLHAHDVAQPLAQTHQCGRNQMLPTAWEMKLATPSFVNDENMFGGKVFLPHSTVFTLVMCIKRILTLEDFATALNLTLYRFCRLVYPCKMAGTG